MTLFAAVNPISAYVLTIADWTLSVYGDTSPSSVIESLFKALFKANTDVVAGMPVAAVIDWHKTESISKPRSARLTNDIDAHVD
ncbi:hypothetical protein N7537_007672 [Penicillium hordei]|uniref:Uncharacterized protein n=1 Tax=Penicillium hordei TaxID=40994 RepID=A0AAD6H0W0_9EURO|nr:uncharacterized protein N7537_007672 [Penicillium hordei]KAJ5597588.1 hypothetical protein N7537_007672 [Penicillium hordei]